MVPETEQIDFRPIEIPQVRRGFWGYVKIGAALMALGGAAWAWQTGYRPPMFSQSSNQPLNLVEIDRGDVEIVVVEQGTVESANNTTVRCQVEALIGTVGGARGERPKGVARRGAARDRAQVRAAAAARMGARAARAAAVRARIRAALARPRPRKKPVRRLPRNQRAGRAVARAPSRAVVEQSASSTASSGGSSGGSSSSSSSSMSSGSGSSAGGSGSGGGSSGTTTTASKPVIRSFSYAVIAHVPLRPVTPKAADSTAQKNAKQAQGGGGGGGAAVAAGAVEAAEAAVAAPAGWGADEKPGSTRILEIVKEGTRVKTGDIVAKLDGAAYEDEEQVQKIRYLQAKSYVEHANTMLEVSQITLKEYRDGIYPQDLQLVRQYIQTCQLEADRLERTLDMVSGHAKKRLPHFVSGRR